MDLGNERDGRVWFYLACAYGQLHATANSPEFRNSVARKACDALTRALEIDPNLRGLARGLLYVDDPAHLPGDNDLATLRDDPRFQKLVGPPPPSQAGTRMSRHEKQEDSEW